MDHLERFLGMMEYRPVDRVPNWELGIWPQTRDRWEADGADLSGLHWNWFSGEASLGMDPREFIPFRCHMVPPFEEETLEEDERTITFRDSLGAGTAGAQGRHGARWAHVDGYLHRLSWWRTWKTGRR